jgi:hypothetical protein
MQYNSQGKWSTDGISQLSLGFIEMREVCLLLCYVFIWHHPACQYRLTTLSPKVETRPIYSLARNVKTSELAIAAR